MNFNLKTDHKPFFFPHLPTSSLKKNFQFENVASDQIKYLLYNSTTFLFNLGQIQRKLIFVKLEDWTNKECF